MDTPLATKLAPPPMPRRALPRPALVALLREALEHRLTLVHAGTGYGKTTALTALAQTLATPVVWYSIEEADADPHRFLSHLLAAFAAALPTLPEAPRAILAERGPEGSRAAWLQALDACINALDATLDAPTLLILDDFHFVAEVPDIALMVTRLLTFLPSQLHVVLATRHLPPYPELLRWRTRGELLDVGAAQLAFTPEETETFLQERYSVSLPPPELAALAAKSEGWPIALPLIGQALRAEQGMGRLSELPALDTLFDYLASDLLARLPAPLAAFLRETAGLRELTPALCDAVRQRDDSAALLDRLHDLDLFIVPLGARRYRYHHLFADFLRQQAASEPGVVRARHRRAAAFLQAVGDDEAAIFHWLAAEEVGAAAEAIARVGEGVLRGGRVGSLAGWIGALPPEAIAAQPALQSLLGDIARLRSRFDEALAWYGMAEQGARGQGDLPAVGRALRGQALVYLDTVRPAQAESLLQDALRLTDGGEDQPTHARLLELLAENKLNLGKPDEAEQLLARARLLRESGPAEDALSVRVKLRTGRLDEAQAILDGWLAGERTAAAQGTLHTPRAHRETVMLLSLIHAFRGEGASALALAEEGIELGRQLGSPFVTALGHARLGHAQQLVTGDAWPPDRRAALGAAIQSYRASIAMGRAMGVRRFSLEPLWGLTRAYGFGGELDAAEATAEEAREIGRSSGDQWVVALAELALGASYALAGRYEEASATLSDVLAAFRECGDDFGRAATRLWLAHVHAHLGQATRLDVALDDALALIEAHRYDFLLTCPSLLGPPDPHLFVPLLLRARARGRYRIAVERLLTALGLEGVEAHPGYALRVETLGTFRLWRGEREIEPREWQREKARQLFQLLLIERGRWLQRDEIVERLWPALSPDAATRDFKVALTTLNRVLEPQRPPDAPFAFIEREGTAYRFRPTADLWLDSEAFERGIEAGRRALAQGEIEAGLTRLDAALALYRGPYLPDALYEGWSQPPRERLLDRFLRASDRLAGALLDAGRAAEAIGVASRAIEADPCWEPAVRALMTAHVAQGEHDAARRLFQRFAATLADELDDEPSDETAALYAALRSG